VVGLTFELVSLKVGVVSRDTFTVLVVPNTLPPVVFPIEYDS
jgi:hypothetical protein